MERTPTARLPVQPFLAIVGLVFVVAAIWAATALAAGGSSGDPGMGVGRL